MEGKRTFFTLIFCIFFINIVKGQDPSLSPATWPAGVMDALVKLENYYGVHPEAKNVMAIYAGLDALNKGGNAMDACLATSMAQITLVAGAYVSYAGIANIVYYNNVTKTTVNINGEWNQLLNPLRNRSDLVKHGDPSPSGSGVLTPGYFAAIGEATKYSKFQLSTLIEPSLYFAKEGFPMNQILYDNMAANANNGTLFRTEEGKKTFLNPETNQIYQIGDLFKQPFAAEFLGNISSLGVDYVYRGPWAEMIGGIVEGEKGNLTSKDMNDYFATLPDPFTTTFNNLGSVITVGMPNMGGVCLIQSVNIMELAFQDGFIDVGVPYGSNGTTIYWMIQISRVVWFISQISLTVDNSFVLFEECLHINTSMEYRITKESAQQLWEMMSAEGGMEKIRNCFRKILAEHVISSSDISKDGKHSDAVIAVDSDGNICSMIHSANSLVFGTGIMVQGVMLPSGALTVPSETLLQPAGVRMPNIPAPMIFFDNNGRAVLSISVVGSSLIEFTQQMFLISTLFKTTPLETILSPLYYTIDLYPLPKLRSQQVYNGTYSNEVINEIESLGQPIYVYDETYLAGFATQIEIQPENNNQMTAATTSLANGFAFAVGDHSFLSVLGDHQHIHMKNLNDEK